MIKISYVLEVSLLFQKIQMMMTSIMNLVSLNLVLVSTMLPCARALNESTEQEGDLQTPCEIIAQELRTGDTGLRTQLMIDHVKSACLADKSPCDVLAQELSKSDLEDLSTRIGKNVCNFRSIIEEKSHLAQHNNESFNGEDYTITSNNNNPLCYCAPRLPIIRELCGGADEKQINSDQVVSCKNISEKNPKARPDLIKGSLIYSIIEYPNSTDNQTICIGQSDTDRDVICGEIIVPILILMVFAIILTLILAYFYIKYRTEGEWAPENEAGNGFEGENYLGGSMTNYLHIQRENTHELGGSIDNLNSTESI